MTLTNPNGTPAIVHWNLCPGAGLKLCDSCQRNDERHPIAALNPNQPRISPPARTDGRCPAWRG